MLAKHGRRDFLGLGLCAAAGALLPGAGCCPCNVSTSYQWNNALRLDGVDPERIVEPKSLQELVDLVRAAESARTTVRMAGSGHSFSDVAMTRGYLFRSSGLDQLLELDRAQLKPEHRTADLVRAESGMRLRALNPALEEKKLALQNMGGYDAQTIVGAASTGTHGSGLDFGPIASQIVSLQIVTTGGAVMQVEPTNGITDPASFPGYIVTKEGAQVPAQLTQSDAVFNALTVGLGCMGVIYAVVLRVVPRFWLHEVRELTTWGELTKPGGFLTRLLAREPLEPNAAQQPEFYEIYFNPYPPKKGDGPGKHRCILTKRYRLTEEPTSLSVDARKRGRWGAGLTESVALATGRGDALADYFNAFPQHVPKSLDDALDSLRDKKFVDASYKVFNLGPANLIRAYGIEMGFDISQTVQATERLFQIAAELREDEIMHSSPPSLRFVKRSEAQLAMMNGRDTMMLEMGMIACANDADELLKTYERRFIDELGARPHWGLDLNVLETFDQVRALYPAADDWHAVYKVFNARGTFNGELTDRLGISINPT